MQESISFLFFLILLLVFFFLLESYGGFLMSLVDAFVYGNLATTLFVILSTGKNF